MTSRTICLGLMLMLLLHGLGFQTEADRVATTTPEYAYQQQVDLDGIHIDFRISPLENINSASGLQEGALVRFEFALSDIATGTPLSGAFPAAWMDLKGSREGTELGRCMDRIEMFVGGSLLSRAELDLNRYYVLTMNDDASLSVVDPLFGFGSTKLLAMVPLRSPAKDWLLTPDQKRLFISLPESNAIAVVETDSWQVLTNIPTAPSPARLVLQADGIYLWVGFEKTESGQERSGVAVLQPTNLAERKRIITGRGHHDIAVSRDNRYAFVTNADDGTVSVVDIRQLDVIKTIPTGLRPTSIAWSEAARAVYVAHEGSGEITAIDAENHQIMATMTTAPGLGQIRFEPTGRLAFAVNPATNLLHIIDTSKNGIVQTGPMAGEPDQVAFSSTLAYVRHRNTEEVLMIPLGEVGQPDAPIPVVDFPGGTHPPGKDRAPALASAIVQAPGANAVLVTNPADHMVYYYMEGMAAPSGAFQNYGRRGRAVLVVDKSLEERRPGVYETTARLRRPGAYDVAFFLETPRSIHCFDVNVAPDPKLQKLRAQQPMQIRAVVEGTTLKVEPGDQAQLTLEVTDPKTGKPQAGLQDLEIMAMMAPGQWHSRRIAHELGNGKYAVSFRVPSEGLYYLYASSAAEHLKLGQTRPIAYMIAVHSVTTSEATPAKEKTQ